MSNFTEFYGSSIFHFTSFFMTKELTGVSFHHSNKNKLGLVRRDEQKPKTKDTRQIKQYTTESENYYSHPLLIKTYRHSAYSIDHRVIFKNKRNQKQCKFL